MRERRGRVFILIPALRSVIPNDVKSQTDTSYPVLDCVSSLMPSISRDDQDVEEAKKSAIGTYPLILGLSILGHKGNEDWASSATESARFGHRGSQSSSRLRWLSLVG